MEGKGDSRMSLETERDSLNTMLPDLRAGDQPLERS